MKPSRIQVLSKVEQDSTNQGLNNFSYPARTELNNFFIAICKYFGLSLNAAVLTRSRVGDAVAKN